MTRRNLFTALSALALVLWVGNVTFAKDEEKGDVHEGTVVSAADGKLTMTDKDGKEHSHEIGATTKITLNGTEAKLGDLKKGDKLKVTMHEKHVMKIAATRKDDK